MNLGALSVIFATFLWAVDTLIRYPLLNEGVSARWIVSVEHLLLTLFFLPLLWKHRHFLRVLQFKDWLVLSLIGGGASALGTLAFTHAFTLINPSIVILFQKLQPLFAITLAVVVLKERVSFSFLIWAIPCLVGAMLLSFEDIWRGLTSSQIDHSALSFFTGLLLTFFTVACWASATVFGKHLTNKGMPIILLTSLRFCIGLIFLIPFLTSELLMGEGYIFDLSIWIKLMAMVLISGVLGMAFYYYGLSQIKARLCALLELFFPLCAVLVNWFFLGISLSLWQLLGAALLLLGSTVLQLKRY